jgi:hypothetical protein
VALNVTIYDVCDQPIPNATFSATAMGPDGKTLSDLSSPCAVPYGDPWPNGISIAAKAPFFYDANAAVSYDGKAWSSSGAVIIGTGDPADAAIDVRIYLCRVRFAPVSTDDPSQATSDYRANGVLPIPRNAFRSPQPSPGSPPGTPPPLPGLLTSPCFDQSAAAPKTISNPIADSLEKDAGWGVWLSLEVGDPPGSKSREIRQLIGVWAPFRTAATPSVIYQITPHTDNGDYPQDPTIPFSGVYPYCCYDSENKGAEKIPINALMQPYVLLPLHRTLLYGIAAYQVYGACPNLFNKDSGPIIITYSPALVAGSVVVEPFDCRETLGRLIGEVLCFLWSNRITGTSKAGSSGVGGRLQANAGTTKFEPLASVPLSYDPFPKSSQTTTLVHSAGVQQLASLISNKTFKQLSQSNAKNLSSFDPVLCWTDNLWRRELESIVDRRRGLG